MAPRDFLNPVISRGAVTVSTPLDVSEDEILSGLTPDGKENFYKLKG